MKLLISFFMLILFFVPDYSQIKIKSSAELKDFVPTEMLAVKIKGLSRRSVNQFDKIEYQLVKDKFDSPEAGDKLKLNETTTAVWKKINSDNTGWFEDSTLSGGYAYLRIDSEKERIVTFEGMAYLMFYDNGSPRIGNIYQYREDWQPWEPNFSFCLLPVKIKKGKNEFLFATYGGRIKVKINDVYKKAALNLKDLTIPDIRINESGEFFGGLVVMNNSVNRIKNYTLVTEGEGLTKTEITVPAIQPLSVRKVRFNFNTQQVLTAGKKDIKIRLLDENKNLIDSGTIQINITDNTSTYKRTFVSNIDGSVQYFAVNPSTVTNKEQALFLALHGAAVEGSGHANSYFNKNWGTIVSPTNRRPYGFNWEDWGRMDALEVLDLAKKSFQIDENRVYLTGHSMGGHGTWHLGGTYPDKFAAIGPSAGWISFWSYRYDNKYNPSNNVLKLIDRTGNQSNTYKLAQNYSQLGVYIIHGKDDDNVRVDQSYGMIKELEKTHKDFVFHEQPGAGHWWDNSDDRGADCVDWKPMFDFFARHSRPLPERILNINFTTANPGISASNNWLAIYDQEKYLEWSNVNLTLEPGNQKVKGTTENVKILSIDNNIFTGKVFTAALDNQEIKDIIITGEKTWFEKTEGNWKIIEKPALKNKGPHRYGLFKDAFRNNMLFVYSTNGSKIENEWSEHKARYDAEHFWYQGNGSVEIIADTDFDKETYKDRNIIIYGNSETNKIWKVLLKDCPIQIKDGELIVGDKKYKGDDIGCLFIYPNKENQFTSIGVVGGTGLEGMRLQGKRPYMSPGFTLPDYTVFNPEIINNDENGYLEAGFFDSEWTLKKAERIIR